MSPTGDPQPRRIAERELVFLLGAISATTALGIDMALPAFTEIRLGLGLAADSPRVALTVTFDTGSASPCGPGGTGLK